MPRSQPGQERRCRNVAVDFVGFDLGLMVYQGENMSLQWMVGTPPPFPVVCGASVCEKIIKKPHRYQWSYKETK